MTSPGVRRVATPPRLLGAMLVSSLIALLLPIAISPAASPPAHTIVDLVPSQGALPDLLRVQTGRARADELRAFVYVHASWCGPCRHLERTLDREPQLQRAFRGVHVIRLDNEAWGDALPRAGLTRNSMPKFFELDENGRPTGRAIDGRAWNDGSAASMAAALDPFFHR